jgi:hypothetical protein
MTDREKALFILGYSQGNQETVMKLMLLLGISIDLLESWHDEIAELKKIIFTRIENK